MSMATKQIAWNTGSGKITLTYAGQGDGPISIQSDTNDGSARSQIINIESAGSAQGGSYDTTIYYGGKGGYSVRELTVDTQTTLYIYVGAQGTGGTSFGAMAGGYNSGRQGYSTNTTYIKCGRGGASDVRIVQDLLYASGIVSGGSTSSATPSQYSTSYRAGTRGTQTVRGNSYFSSTANSASYGSLASFGVSAGSASTS